MISEPSERLKMRKMKISLLALVVLAGMNTAEAQFADRLNTAWKYTKAKWKEGAWSVGLGWSIVEDEGRPFKGIADVKNWNFPGFPGQLNCEKYFDKGFSFALNATYNQYKPGKLINNEIISTSSTFLALDLNVQYDFTHSYDINQKWFRLKYKVFDMYGATGFGYTYRSLHSGPGVGTYNIGIGMHAWIYEGFGINLNSMAKFGLVAPIIHTNTNYLMYSVGIIYRIKVKDHLRFARYTF
jgi:hypothetical protein